MLYNILLYINILLLLSSIIVNAMFIYLAKDGDRWHRALCIGIAMYWIASIVYRQGIIHILTSVGIFFTASVVLSESVLSYVRLRKGWYG